MEETDCGWTVDEALHFVVPEYLLEKARNDQAAVITARQRASSSRRRLSISDDVEAAKSQQRRERAAARTKAESVSAVLKHLFNLARRGEVSAFGIRGATIGAYEKIPQHQFASFTEVNADISALFSGKLEDGTIADSFTYYCVTFYPPLLAPNSAAVVTGRLLADVIDKFVWGDPEIGKIWCDGLGREGRPGDCLIIQTDRSALIALHETPTAMRAELDRIQLGDRLGITGEIDDGWITGHFLDAIARRLAALGEMIAKGDVSLTGLAPDSDCRETIALVDVEAGRLLVDLATGDLFSATAKVKASYTKARLDAPSVVSMLQNSIAETSVVEQIDAEPSDIGYESDNDQWPWLDIFRTVLRQCLEHKIGPIQSMNALCGAIEREIVNRERNPPSSGYIGKIIRERFTDFYVLMKRGRP